MTTAASFRLHLATNIRVADSFASLHASLEERASLLVDAGRLNDAAVWELAQYVDLTDAGYGSRATVLYRRVSSCLGAYVRQNLSRPTARGMFGRSATLAQLVDQTLDERAMTEGANNVIELAA